MFQIEIIRGSSRKICKNAINSKPHTFDTREDAEAFAQSIKRDFMIDRAYRQSPKALAVYKVVEC